MIVSEMRTKKAQLERELNNIEMALAVQEGQITLTISEEGRAPARAISLTESRAKTAKAFQRLGLSEKAASIAARGRRL
jgi:hypothetical protein